MPERVPEPNKLPGVRYAFTPEGIEVPVIDVSLPVFRNERSEAAILADAERYKETLKRPGLLKGLFFKFVVPRLLRRSVIGRGLIKGMGGYLDAVTTYLLKLPPEAMGAWATKTDRKIAESMRLSSQTVSLRLQDMAELLAAALEPCLRAQPGAELHFVSIAGGPSIDSMNVLILLRKRDASLLDGRRIRIHVLDLETDGAAFGQAALESLEAEGGPLHGLDLSKEHVPYDWNDAQALAARLQSLPPDAVVAASSEGGLFDYGTDEAVAANLKTLRQGCPAGTVLAASLSRPDGVAAVPTQRLGALVLRSAEDFEKIAEPAGWSVKEKRGRPMSWVLYAA